MDRTIEQALAHAEKLRRSDAGPLNEPWPADIMILAREVERLQEERNQLATTAGEMVDDIIKLVKMQVAELTHALDFCVDGQMPAEGVAGVRKTLIYLHESIERATNP